MNIYALIHPITKEIRYIGQTKKTLKKRLNQHIASSKYDKRKSHRISWLQSLKKENLAPEIIELVSRISTQEELNSTEVFLIDFGRSIGLRLTNQTRGGQGEIDFSKIKRKPHSPEHIEKFRKAGTAALTGRKASPEERQKVSLSLLGNDRGNKEIHCSDGRIFKSQVDAAKKLGVNLKTIYVATKHSKPIKKLNNITLHSPYQKSIPKPNNSKTIYCNDGREFADVPTAMKELKVSRKCIDNALKGLKTRKLSNLIFSRDKNEVRKCQ